MKMRDLLNEIQSLPRSTKNMKTDEEIFQFFATHGGYKELDSEYLKKIETVCNFLKSKLSNESWKMVLNYLKRSATYQDALWPLTQIANTLGLDPSWTKGILIRDLKLGLKDLIQNGELEVNKARAFKSGTLK